MQKKKIISIFLALVLIFCNTAICVFAEANKETIVYSENIVADSGTVISVPIYIINNVGFSGFRISLKYDKNVFSPISVEKGSALNTTNSGFFNDNIGVVSSTQLDVVWTSAVDIINDGCLFSVNFAISNSAKGSYNFEISYEQDDTFNSTFKDVKFNCNNFNVRVDNSSFLESPYFSVPNISCNNGEIINVPVILTNNIGLDTTTFTMLYDKSIFTPLSIVGEKTEICTSNIDDADGELQILIGNISETLGDGTVFTVRFQVSEKAIGNYNISLQNQLNIPSECAEIFIENKQINDPAVISFGNYIVQEDVSKFTVPVTITNNYGLMGYKIIFNYDCNIIRPISVTSGKDFDGSLDYNARKLDEFVVIWNNSQNVNKDGIIMNITFEVISDDVSKTTVEGSYSEDDTFNADWKNVALSFEKMNIYFQNDEMLIAAPNTDTVIENGYIYGLPTGGVYIQNYVSAGAGYEISFESSNAYTGTVVNVYYEDVLIKTYVVIIFGDVNGDGYYDGMDATVEKCIIDGMLSKDDIDEATYIAADCNHDGTINNSDTELLERAGVFLTEIDQSKR